MTTKAQELETLGKIRELLGTLDADGWVNMAFKGVCDIAENNIRDDFADSPVERVEVLERELKETEAKLRTWKGDAECFKSEFEKIRKEYDELVLKNDARREVLKDIKSKFEYDLTRANALILEHCAEADSEIFKNAVALRKNAQYWSDKIGEVI